MALRELERDSIHWGGYAGMRLQNDPNDPLPNPLLGGLDVDDFLAHHLAHSSNPLASGLGMLVDSGSEVSELSCVSAAWSLRDPPGAFYEEVFDYIFSTPGPAMPSDAVRTVPRVVNHTMTVRSFQTSDDPDSGVFTDTQIVTQVTFVKFLYISGSYVLFIIHFSAPWLV